MTTATTQMESTESAFAGLKPSIPIKEPAVDVYEHEDEFLMQVDMPGARRDAIGLRYDRGTLTLEAMVATPANAGRALLREFRPVQFRRVFKLGDVIDADRIQANYENGVLTVTLPKTLQAKPKAIAVKGS